MITIGLDQSPLHNANSGRGIGSYTRGLIQSLKGIPDLNLIEWPTSHQVDLIHYPFFDLFFPTLPLHKAFPTVVTIHDVIPLLFPKEYPAGVKGKINFVRQIASLRNVKVIVTDSQASKKDISKYLRVPSHKIQVVYLAANSGLGVASEAAVGKAKKKYHLPDKYVLYVGDINYNKNLPQLIKALKFLPAELHLVCVGKNFYPHEIPEWKAIETQIALSDVSHRIKFVTDLESDKLDELSAIYTGAVVYVQPSLAEGFGLPVLEAMQCMTPVICANNSSLLEVAGQAAFMVEPQAESIADGIKIISEWTKIHRAEIVHQAFTWSQTFSWSKTAEQMADIYRSVIKS